MRPGRRVRAEAGKLRFGPVVEAPTIDPLGERRDAEALDPPRLRGARRPSRRLRGRTARRELTVSAERDRIAALRRFAQEQPEEAAEAELLALTALAGLRPPSPEVADEAARFLEQHPSAPQSAAVQVIAAAAAFDPDLLADPALEGHAEAVAAMADTARAVVAEQGDSPYARDAWYWQLRDATLREDRAAMKEILAVLRERWGDDEEFWDEESYYLFAARLAADGLPEFSVASLDGEPLDLEGFRGQVTLIDFWATWCGPCLEQLPRLKEIYGEYHPRGFEIVGVSADDEDRLDRAAFRAWLDEESVTWPQLYDGKGWENELLRLYDIQGIPTSILLDREGRVAGVDLEPDALESKLEQIL